MGAAKVRHPVPATLAGRRESPPETSRPPRVGPTLRFAVRGGRGRGDALDEGHVRAVTGAGGAPLARTGAIGGGELHGRHVGSAVHSTPSVPQETWPAVSAAVAYEARSSTGCGTRPTRRKNSRSRRSGVVPTPLSATWATGLGDIGTPRGRHSTHPPTPPCPPPLLSRIDPLRLPHSQRFSGPAGCHCNSACRCSGKRRPPVSCPWCGSRLRPKIEHGTIAVRSPHTRMWGVGIVHTPSTHAAARPQFTARSQNPMDSTGRNEPGGRVEGEGRKLPRVTTAAGRVRETHRSGGVRGEVAA